MKFPRSSEIVDTQKAPEEIRRLISKNAIEYKLFETGKDTQLDFSYKFDSNLIYLKSFRHKYWPTIELELREFTPPRLKVHYAVFGFYRTFYLITFLVALTANFQIESSNQLIGLVASIGLFLSIPIVAIRWQKNFRNWLDQTLKS